MNPLAMKLFKRSQPARLCLEFAKDLHMIPDKLKTISLKEVMEDIENREKRIPQKKSIKTLANFLDGTGIITMQNDTLHLLVPFVEFNNICTTFQCTDDDLRNAKPVIREAMFGGLTAKEFQQKGDGVFNYVRKCQKESIPSIVLEIKKQCEKFSGKLIIYDIGCGDGAIAIEVAKAVPNATIYAYDPNEIAIMKANADKPKGLKNLTFSTTQFPKDGEVHLVLCINVFHDVAEPDKFAQMISKKLHNTGIGMIADPLVSIDKAFNRRHVQCLEANAFGFIDCVHASDCIHAMGPAMGKENIQDYMENNDLLVFEDFLPGQNFFYHTLLVKKNLSGKLPKKYPLLIEKYDKK